MNHPLLAALAVPLLGALAVPSLRSQDSAEAPLEFPAPSPASTIQQRVGVTDIEVVYGRPSMRGRKIFGGLEPFGTIWRTGANSATKVSFSTDVNLGGLDVPAGSYALMSIPTEGEWTIILNKVDDQFGTYNYDEKNDIGRFQVQPQALEHGVETLEFGFSDLSSGSATLYFQWENTRVAMPLMTNVVAVLMPKIEAAMAGDGPKPYFPAAMFYYENDLDMDKAAAWIGEAVKAQPTAFWISYRMGLILEKKGDKQGAIEAAKKSMGIASKASGSVKAEYVRLNEALIARCK